jgi:N-acetylglucosaminyldiphosphoundecaprenol N-acetyl-beta-D-mannosaminyltransferase
MTTPVDSRPALHRLDLPTIDLLGVRIHAITEREVIAQILAELDGGRGGWIATPNLDHLRRLCRDPTFRTLCLDASLLVPDGVPLLWASRLQGTPLPGRVAGSDLISSLSAAAAAAGRSLFMLGGDPGTAEAAAATLRQRHGELRIVGTYCPPFGFEQDAAEPERIQGMLRTAAPDIVFVALGSPKQERLMQEMSAVLPRAWWVGVGISFSLLTGEVKRAPVWVQRTGLEWVHRLLQEPRRLAGRYLWHGLPFGVRLLASCAWRGLRRPRSAIPRSGPTR